MDPRPRLVAQGGRQIPVRAPRTAHSYIYTAGCTYSDRALAFDVLPGVPAVPYFSNWAGVPLLSRPVPRFSHTRRNSGTAHVRSRYIGKLQFLALHVARGFRNLKSCLVHLICHILERLRDIPKTLKDITQKL